MNADNRRFWKKAGFTTEFDAANALLASSPFRPRRGIFLPEKSFLLPDSKGELKWQMTRSIY
jgi:hypothetical protein